MLGLVATQAETVWNEALTITRSSVAVHQCAGARVPEQRARARRAPVRGLAKGS